MEESCMGGGGGVTDGAVGPELLLGLASVEQLHDESPVRAMLGHHARKH